MFFCFCCVRSGLCLGGCHKRNDVDELASVLARCERHCTVDESIESVVLAHAHVATGMVCGATLTLDDVAGLYNLTAKLLDAESFALFLAARVFKAHAIFVI